jgi:catechol 2,3-dioxygenase-like lactoylglutathione lyase family enzyme
MARLLLNIDVPNLAQGIAFYTAALGLRVGRHFDDAFVELIGGDFPIYLLEKDAGTPSGPAGGEYRATIAIGHPCMPISSSRTSRRPFYGCYR